MFNVNCVYATRTSYRIICDHPDRSRALKIFRRSCIEPEIDCSLKVEFKKPNIQIASPPPAKIYW
jgi:hypothetical protein